MSDIERDKRIHSLRILVEYYWIYLHQLHEAVSARLGDAGLKAIGAGLRSFGHYRGESIRRSPRSCAEGRDALSLMRCWDVADLALYAEGDQLSVQGDAKQIELRLERLPGIEYFQGRDSASALQTYWTETLAGLVSGYDSAISFEHDPIVLSMNQPWRLSWRYSGDTADSLTTLPSDPFGDMTRSIELSRRTVGVFSALCMYTARSLMERFDATGEEVVREALYNFGVERADGMREQALADGKPLDMQSWFETMQARDPNSSAWVFRGNTHISPGVFQVTCTYCPMAEVWSEEGGDGLGFGYLYDMEVHRGLVEGFHPRGVVAWDKVKTRGDRVCNFRFRIPELVTESDPDWAQSAD